ncbi:MAG: cadherin repeat domain-containing protein, partial [Candidatus Gracilibacteria bacterium]|nr:cadherin repeat domain-containing protein [Candidatus Gracilibacteria bacterium]
ISSDENIIFWNSINAGIFRNDIFGIGRDDISLLGHVKSQSMEDDSVIVITAEGEGNNQNPTFSDISDQEYLMVANDNGGNTWTATNTPSNFHRLSRVWNVQETGEIGTISMEFDMENILFDIPDLSTGTEYYFLVDTNNNQSFGDETPQPMVNVGGGKWLISGVNLGDNSLFTLATLSSFNNIPTDISLTQNFVDENFVVGGTIGSFSTIDSDVSDVHSYSFISGAGDEDNAKFSIVGNFLQINQSPDYEIQNQYSIRVQTDDGNGGQFQKSFIITVNNLGETVNSIIDFEAPGKYSVTSGTWNRATNNANQGIFSIETNNGGTGNTQSCFEVEHTFAAQGTIRFDYSVSTQQNGDFLRFYIDNVEEDNWSGNVIWTEYLKDDISSGTHKYKWCYIKDGNTNTGNDTVYIDFITFENTSVDTTDPSIIGTNFNDQILLPGGLHNIIINYLDAESGIDTNSDLISLYKWNGTSWGGDISSTGLDLGGKIITNNQASYSMNNLDFGKYRYDFSISDTNGNTSTVSREFYIDIPQISVSTGSLDIGDISAGGLQFSNNEIQITVETVGAGFQVFASQDDLFSNGSAIIINWDGIQGIGYDIHPYSGLNKNINTENILATQVSDININGEKNSYTYSINIGTLIEEQQAAGVYSTHVSFYLQLDY